MTDQLALVGVPTPPDLKLTPRQRFSLELIGLMQPLPSEDLGAALHEYRRDRGGSGHSATSSCSFCKPEGAHMGARLRELGLVRYSRLEGGWYLVGSKPRRRTESAQTGEIPF